MKYTKDSYKAYAELAGRAKDAFYEGSVPFRKADATEREAASDIIEELAHIMLAKTREDAEAHWARIAELAQLNVAEEF